MQRLAKYISNFSAVKLSELYYVKYLRKLNKSTYICIYDVSSGIVLSFLRLFFVLFLINF